MKCKNTVWDSFKTDDTQESSTDIQMLWRPIENDCHARNPKSFLDTRHTRIAYVHRSHVIESGSNLLCSRFSATISVGPPNPGQGVLETAYSNWQ
jgi:hypothetical protein